MHKKSIILGISFILALTLLIAKATPTVLAVDTLKVFSAADLSQYDGQNGHPAYFAYNGQVYDVTGDPQWTNGNHYGNLAGHDLSGQMAGAPHGEEVLNGLAVVGTYTADAAASSATTQATSSATVSQKWYEGRLRFLGFSILAWTGVLLGICFILNFATCFALPWSHLPLPWRPKVVGADPTDPPPPHLPWSSLHKYFAWATVVLGLIHGIIGLMQMFGYTL